MASRSAFLRFCLCFLFYSHTCFGALRFTVNDIGDSRPHDPSDDDIYIVPEVIEQQEANDLSDFNSALLSELNARRRKSQHGAIASGYLALEGNMQGHEPELASKGLLEGNGYEDLAVIAAHHSDANEHRDRISSSYSKVIDDFDSSAPTELGLGKSDGQEKRTPTFRLGKRADDDRLEKRMPTFRLGKRELPNDFDKRDPTFRLGKREYEEDADKRSVSFRLGKRNTEEKRTPTFRLGKRENDEDIEKRGPMFRLGKRVFDDLEKRDPTFRLGKREYKDFEKRAPKFRLGKRVYEGLVKRTPTFRLGERDEEKRAPTFRLGKREQQWDDGKRAPKFRLGKRSEEEKRSPTFRLGKRDDEW